MVDLKKLSALAQDCPETRTWGVVKVILGWFQCHGTRVVLNSLPGLTVDCASLLRFYGYQLVSVDYSGYFVVAGGYYSLSFPQKVFSGSSVFTDTTWLLFLKQTEKVLFYSRFSLPSTDGNSIGIFFLLIYLHVFMLWSDSFVLTTTCKMA